MQHGGINRISAIAPVAMSLAAFIMVVVAAVMGRANSQPDEGTLAHIFQLLIAAQMPVILLFLVTADCRHSTRVARPLALQGAAIILAVGSVYYLNL